MTGRQNRDINHELVNTIRASAWRKPSAEAPTRAYDRPPPNAEPGYLAFLKRDDQVAPEALIRTQLNPEGLGHPVLILAKDEHGILYCLPLTSFNNSGHLRGVARTKARDYRFITHAPEAHAEQVKESMAAGSPLKLNSQLEKTCWVNQAQVLRVELQSLKVYVNGRHRVDDESLEKMQRYCKQSLPGPARRQSPETKPGAMHSRKDSGYSSDGTRSDPRKLDNWRARE